MKVFKCCVNCEHGIKIAVPIRPNMYISQERIDELKRFNAAKRICIAVYNPKTYDAHELRHCKGFEPRRLFDGETYYTPAVQAGEESR